MNTCVECKHFRVCDNSKNMGGCSEYFGKESRMTHWVNKDSFACYLFKKKEEVKEGDGE